jgi:hypothetical protein
MREQKNLFPSWIIKSVKDNPNHLNPKSAAFFQNLLDIYPHFQNAFLEIPDTSDIGILKSYDPEEVQLSFGIESPHEFILLNVFEQFHFQAVYQMRELAISLLSFLTEGKFYISAITCRAMLEVICVNYYTFWRVEDKFKQCLELLKNTSKTKSATEKSRILNTYYQVTYELFSKVFDANGSTSINWSEYLRDRFDITLDARQDVRKINVLTAIEDIETKSGLPLQNAYKILSEFAHPNAGSKMLIVNTKRSRYPLMDALTIGENKGNSEAALFYIDHFAESIYYAWTLALTFFHRGQKLIAVLDDLVPLGTSRNVH